MTRHISEPHDVTFSPWECDAFAARLKAIMEERGTTAYAIEREAKIANSLIRKYLKGESIPGADKLVALSKVLKVSISWLALGQEESPSPGVQEEGASYGPQIDYDQLEEVTFKTLRMFQDRGVSLKPEAQARIIRLIYEYVQRTGMHMDSASLDNVIELAAFR